MEASWSCYLLWVSSHADIYEGVASAFKDVLDVDEGAYAAVLADHLDKNGCLFVECFECGG